MASSQSSPPCSPLGVLLLLLIGVISSHLPGVQARPVDFWCKREARENMVEILEDLKKDMADCVGSHMLPSPLQLPCVWVQPAEWANKAIQQKRAEILEALRVFQDFVQGATNQTTLQCQASLLRLGHHIRNYIALVNNLQIQDTEPLDYPAVQTCPTQSKLDKVLEQYGLLLKGKLERLAVDLRDTLCNVQPSIANT